MEPVDRREFLTCSLCLDIFQDPRLLPCSHTFCRKCLDRLIARHSASFPCPMCREPTTIPPGGGGAKAFKTNHYILSQDLARAKNWSLCLTHDKVLEFYCSKCSEAICINCKLTKHDCHDTVDLKEAADKAQEELARDKSRLKSAVIMMDKRIRKGQKEQGILQDNKSEMKRKIHSRHAMVVATADQCRDEALKSLESLAGDEKKKLSDEIDRLQRDKAQLLTLQERVKKSLDSKTQCELVTVAREMKYGQGSSHAVGKLTSLKTSSARRVQHSWPAFLSRDDLKCRVDDFMGTVILEDVPVAKLVMPSLDSLDLYRRVLSDAGSRLQRFYHVDDSA